MTRDAGCLCCLAMKATAMDLRCKTKEIFAALERRETVSLHVRGKLAGYIVPARHEEAAMKVEDHPFFGSRNSDHEDVTAIMKRLRSHR